MRPRSRVAAEIPDSSSLAKLERSLTPISGLPFPFLPELFDRFPSRSNCHIFHHYEALFIEAL
jgi:hypothetical protein